jgi:uncharacterized protein YjbJ (UPF0337 family)
MRMLMLLAIAAGGAWYLARRRGISMVQMRGEAKDFVGRATGDDSMRAAGMADKARGKAGETLDRMRETVQG